MTRHGQNQEGRNFHSREEQRKMKKYFGLIHSETKITADALKPWHYCSLTLQPCKNPVISPKGYIFEKEAILEYILEQKKEYKRYMKIWEEQNKLLNEKSNQDTKYKEEMQKRKFLDLEMGFSSGTTIPKPTTSKIMAGTKRKLDGTCAAFAGGKKLKDEGSENPEQLEKPSDQIKCPITGDPLKFKEMMAVKFTPINKQAQGGSKDDIYMCPVTCQTITNSSKVYYLKTSQVIVSTSCVDTIIKKEKVDPLNGKPIKDGDIIELVRGGNNVKIQVSFPVMVDVQI